jgi:hypothetical protein
MGKIIPKVIHTNSKKKKKVPKIRNRPWMTNCVIYGTIQERKRIFLWHTE